MASPDSIKNFFNEHVSKIASGVALYFLSQLSGDIKDMKNSIQVMLTNQATIEIRLNNLESNYKELKDKQEKTYDLAQGNRRALTDRK